MNIEQAKEKVREFDRQIKEIEGAARYALTVDEKLTLMQQAKTMQERKKQFIISAQTKILIKIN